MKRSDLVCTMICWVAKDLGLPVPSIYQGLDNFVIGFSVGQKGIQTISITKDIVAMSWAKTREIIEARLAAMVQGNKRRVKWTVK